MSSFNASSAVRALSYSAVAKVVLRARMFSLQEVLWCRPVLVATYVHEGGLTAIKVPVCVFGSSCSIFFARIACRLISSLLQVAQRPTIGHLLLAAPAAPSLPRLAGPARQLRLPRARQQMAAA